MVVVSYWAFHTLVVSQAHTSRGENDLPGTLHEAGFMRLWPLRPSAPHFLLPALVRALAPVMAPATALCVVAALATAGAHVAAGLWVVDDARSAAVGRWWGAAAVAVGLFVFESPLGLVTDSFSDVHHWASATDALSLALLAVWVWLVVHVGRRCGAGGDIGRVVLATGLVGVLATLAKPSLMLVAWLIGGLYVLFPAPALRRPDRTRLAAAAGVALPVVATIAWQTWWLRSGDSPFDSASGWTLHPLWMFGGSTPWTVWVPAVLLVPGLVWWACGNDVWRDGFFRLAAALWVASLGPTLLLQETGAQRLDGNFTVGTRLALWLLVAASLRIAARRFLGSGVNDHRPATAPVWIALAVVLMLGAAAGVTQLVGIG